MLGVRLDRGLAAAVLAPLFIALGIVFTKLAARDVHPLLLAAVAPLLSLIVTLPLAGRLELRRLLGELRGDVLRLIVARSVLGNVLLVAGLAHTTAVKAILVLRLEAVFVMLWGIMLLGERPRPMRLALLGALIVGTLLAVSPDGIPALAPGDLLVAAGVFLFAYSYQPTGRLAGQVSPQGLAVVTNAVGGVVLLVAAVVTLPASQLRIPPAALLATAGYAVSFYVVGLGLFFRAFRTVEQWVIASLLSLEVVAGLLLAVGVLGEPLTAVQAAGAAIILVVMLGVARENRPVAAAGQPPVVAGSP